jgi:hypothetical protein
VVFPAAALLITTLAFNLLGDGIRDAMDPRTERVFAGGWGRRRRARRSKTASTGGAIDVPPVAPFVPPGGGN